MSHLTPARRAGFTLVELLVALVLLAIVGTGILRTLMSNQRAYEEQTQRIDVQQNLRTALAVLPADFRELDAVDGDVDQDPRDAQARDRLHHAGTRRCPHRAHHDGALAAVLGDAGLHRG
jgi:prepilin-type N-terminal cleavage/methylation domain-containing protein